MSPSAILKMKFRHPRQNLPTARKRAEANFVAAFARAYIAEIEPGIGSREFALEGFGIADFIWIDWRRKKSGEASALSLAWKRKMLETSQMTAFEMKMSDWKKGLNQAFRYTYFAETSILVLPSEVANTAANSLVLFKRLNIGLWGFDKRSGMISKIFTPFPALAKNLKARQRAVEQVLKLSKFDELTNSLG